MRLVRIFRVLFLLLPGCHGVRFEDDPQPSKPSTECAIKIPVRSSSREDTEETPRGAVKTRCITYQDVDDAFETARVNYGLRRTGGGLGGGLGGLSSFHLDHLGTVLQEATRLIADRYQLTARDIAHRLPLVDTLRSPTVSRFCPGVLSQSDRTKCQETRFRRHDGGCNNLFHPNWGGAPRSFRRLLAPHYYDGISEPRAGRSGEPLPNPRLVSEHMHQDAGPANQMITVMFVTWGQLIDHDLTLTAETKDPVTGIEPPCCPPDPSNHPNCMPVQVPAGDAFYQRHKQNCLSVIRSLAGVRDKCALGPRSQTNLLTSYIDANFVYGSSFRATDNLRELQGGRLRTTSLEAPAPEYEYLGTYYTGPVKKYKDILPLKFEKPDDGCLRPPTDDKHCFLAGDNRANEQVGLGVLHTIFVREHNRIADELHSVNPHWDDEQLFQETRHIIAAMVQHITYNEFLPLLLGDQSMKKYNLQLTRKGYYNGYNASVDATVPASFVTAAFRFGHSLLPPHLDRYSSNHRYLGSTPLSRTLQQPFELLLPGRVDQYLIGMANQAAMAMDDAVTAEVTNHLFQGATRNFGKDLATINLVRGREHGVPGYNAFRKYCHLVTAHDWAALSRSVGNETTAKFKQLFEHPDDIDLWSAGISEIPHKGSLVGPTFNCIIGHTFRDLRRGDRFWYENPGWPSSFTPEQLKEIRKTTLARLLCDAGDNVGSLQKFVMKKSHPASNPRVPCLSPKLPRINLVHWRDYDSESREDASLNDTRQEITAKPDSTQENSKDIEDTPVVMEVSSQGLRVIPEDSDEEKSRIFVRKISEPTDPYDLPPAIQDQETYTIHKIGA